MAIMDSRWQAQADRLEAIKLLLLDVDGVLTDGFIHYNDAGIESKPFYVRDGLGMRLAMENDLSVGIVTGRKSKALEHRCRDMGITLIFQGVLQKATVLDQACRQTGVDTHQVAFIGDDIIDLPLLKRVGLAIAVADAHPLVIAAADIVTRAAGGRGAAREVCEAILMARGRWQSALARFEA